MKPVDYMDKEGQVFLNLVSNIVSYVNKQFKQQLRTKTNIINMCVKLK